jgi:predicted glutamine amidotransferase
LCGIVGYIGNPLNQAATFDLINQLMIKTEPRGEHATGFWAAIGEGDKRVVYHKEPVKSTVFVNHELWRSMEERKANLLIGHCRWTSPGGGPEKVNKNNHPHVSQDYRVALVHNGKIPEYNYLKKRYNVNTDCDSEVLLRIFESAEDHHDQIEYLRKELPKVWDDTPDDLLYRIFGLKRVFSEVNYGAMAVAIGERLEGDARSLFLFRNELRPICLIDLRDTLGQFFFCSTPEIFRQAIDASTIAKEVIPANQPVYPELPENWIYSFILSQSGDIDIRRLKVNKVRKYGYWDQSTDEEEASTEAPKSEVKLVRTQVDILTRLNASEEPIPEPKSVDDSYDDYGRTLLPVGPIRPDTTTALKKRNPYGGCYTPEECDANEVDSGDVDGSASTRRRESAVSTKILNHGFQEVHPTPNYDDDDNELAGASAIAEDVAETCTQAENLISEISTHVYNKVQEGSLTTTDVEDVLEGLKEIVNDLESCKCLLKM